MNEISQEAIAIQREEIQARFLTTRRLLSELYQTVTTAEAQETIQQAITILEENEREAVLATRVNETLLDGYCEMESKLAEVVEERDSLIWDTQHLDEVLEDATADGWQEGHNDGYQAAQANAQEEIGALQATIEKWVDWYNTNIKPKKAS